MTGLVERLRDALEAFKDAPGHRWVDLTVNVGPDGDLPILNRAYVTLEDLREIAARIEALEAGLRPFAEIGQHIKSSLIEYTIRAPGHSLRLADANDFRHAASLLLSSGGGGSA